MKSGIPVETVAINGGARAGILSVKMLAMSDDALLEKLKEYKDELKDGVVAKAKRLDQIGYKEYLNNK